MSCGCKRSKLVSKKNTKHGLSTTKFYRHWRSMQDRMSDKYIDRKSYKNISICKRWLKFENFRDDMYKDWIEHNKLFGGRNTTLDRISVFKGYSKKNCRWATQKEQSRNKKNTIYVEYKGEQIVLIDLCENFNWKFSRIYGRLKRGYSLENAINYKLWQRN